MTPEHERKARSILRRVLYATVATTSPSGEPWNTPLYCAFDASGAIYWASSPDACHSVNIASNGRAFLVVYDSTAEEGSGEGVYIEARAEALSGRETIEQADRCLSSRVGKSQMGVSAFLPPAPLRIYRATAERAWINDEATDDEGRFVHDTRVELSLSVFTALEAQ